MDHAASLAAQDEFARLDRAESFRMLAAVAVGRLIFTSNALPAVLPVNFALADGLIVLRTAAAIVARKVHDMIVAFEADDLDPATFSGWSVTGTGRAALVTDLGIIARYQGPPLVP
jgi:nitroimidazol reductase NimA-like FMN-containing flavoprotein (pyridoxamine 5'-phosphate oxidase superfamily)